MRIFRRRQAIAVKAAPVPAAEPFRRNGSGFSNAPPTAIAIAAADDEPRILLGIDVANGKKVYLSLSQLRRPTHIQGGAGERKTLLQAYLAEEYAQHDAGTK